MPSKKHIGKESNEKERNRKRKGKHFMNAPEAGGLLLWNSKTLDSLRETSHSALLIDLGTERNGSFFFSVRLCWDNWRLLHSVPNTFRFLTFANFRFRNFDSESIQNPSWRLIRRGRQQSAQRRRKPLEASSWAGENRFMDLGCSSFVTSSAIVQLTSVQAS